MTYRVLLTQDAKADLERLEGFLLDRAQETGDWDLALRAVAAIEAEFAVLERNPFTCRRAGADPLERELVIPFGRSGYVALFYVESEDQVVVAALRHQREDDRW